MQYNVPQAEADERLIALIKEHAEGGSTRTAGVRPRRIQNFTQPSRDRNRPVTVAPALRSRLQGDVMSRGLRRRGPIRPRLNRPARGNEKMKKVMPIGDVNNLSESSP